MPDYNFSMRSDIMHAISRHKAIECNKSKWGILDGAILCLVKSFSDNGQEFYMSNKQLGNLFAADPGTVQRAIDRLTDEGLLTKEKGYHNATPYRKLIYQYDAVKKFIAQKD